MKSINEKIADETSCTNYCLGEAVKRMKRNDFVGASVFYENVARSLKELDGLLKEQEDLKNGKIVVTAAVMRRWNAFD